jgi:molecular chaperone GrpE
VSEVNGAAAGEPEPVTVVDNRTIDPATGEVRKPSPAAGEVEEEAAEVVELAEQPAVEQATESAPAATELAERTADLQRLTAEYANYRRRVERDRVTAVENAKAVVVADLLVVLDDLDRARAHGDLESGPLKSVADKLTAALAKTGVTEFGAEGESFDPMLHEAVQHEGDGHNPVIGTVMRKGYRIGDRVLRHALVGVTDAVDAPEPAAVDGGDNDEE